MLIANLNTCIGLCKHYRLTLMIRGVVPVYILCTFMYCFIFVIQVILYLLIKCSVF